MRARRITYIGVTHRTRSVDELREETRVMWKDLADAIAAGKLSAADRQDVSARSSRRRAGVHEGQPAFREDLADALISFGETT